MAIAPSGPTVGAPGLGIDSSVIAFMREERDFMAAQMKEQKEEVERQRKEMERQMKEMEANLSPAAAISGEQLIRVQARLEKLHAAKLLTDDELFAMEVRTAD
jgi:DNA-binding transcriptional MerR regulator